MKRVKARFRAKGFPNCCDAIDGTHLLVELPLRENHVDYFDYKHNVLVSMQAIVDLQCRFLDVCFGWPGSIQDSQLLKISYFYRFVVYDKVKLAGPPFLSEEGTLEREFLLVDVDYPLYD